MNKFWISMLAAGVIAAGSLLAVSPALAADDEITVISREDGSGTRGAFIELFKIEEKNAAGKKVDNTVDSADITNSTSVMMTSVAGNPQAIGYISLGSLNTSVKALHIDGAEASVAAIKSGAYKIARPFNIATKDEMSPVAKDFIAFMLSKDGQDVVAAHGYISVDDKAPAYAGSRVAGRIVVGGSSSVTPIMEKLKEAYVKKNPNATVEIQQSDSTTGMTSALSGVLDIGMASRALKDSELKKGLKPVVIAMDGIAVIVNNGNPVNNLTSAQVKAIYTGKTTSWGELNN